jgi:hypothetical protein
LKRYAIARLLEQAEVGDRIALIQEKAVDAIQQIGRADAARIEMKGVVASPHEVAEHAKGPPAPAGRFVERCEIVLPVSNERRGEVVEVGSHDLARLAVLDRTVAVGPQDLQIGHVFPDVGLAEGAFGRGPPQFLRGILVQHWTAEVFGQRRSLSL